MNISKLFEGEICEIFDQECCLTFREVFSLTEYETLLPQKKNNNNNAGTNGNLLKADKNKAVVVNKWNLSRSA